MITLMCLPNIIGWSIVGILTSFLICMFIYQLFNNKDFRENIAIIVVMLLIIATIGFSIYGIDYLIEYKC